jgi:acetyl-CoA C-acetyltransferase
VVGVGQASERLEAQDYQRRSPVDLAGDAVAEALADTGADPAAVAAAIDTVAGVRQFENSVPGARAPLGRSDNYPRSVAGRINTPSQKPSGGPGARPAVTGLSARTAAS